MHGGTRILLAAFAAVFVGVGVPAAFADDPAPPPPAAPAITSAAALSNSTVKVVFSEPVNTSAATAADFKLLMAGQARSVTAIQWGSDSQTAVITGSPSWQPGEAGDISLVDGIPDAEGNSAPSPGPVRVYAAPGDFTAPALSQASFSPSVICLGHAKRTSRRPSSEPQTQDEADAGAAASCRTRVVISFALDEPARVTATFSRGRYHRRLTYSKRAGTQRIVISRATKGFTVPAGRYRVSLQALDGSSNRSGTTKLSGYLTVRR